MKLYYTLFMLKRIDYLAEIEMGNAPPLELIKKNIQYDPDEYRNQRTLNEVLQHGKEYANEAHERIEEAMREVLFCIIPHCSLEIIAREA